MTAVNGATIGTDRGVGQDSPPWTTIHRASTPGSSACAGVKQAPLGRPRERSTNSLSSYSGSYRYSRHNPDPERIVRSRLIPCSRGTTVDRLAKDDRE